MSIRTNCPTCGFVSIENEEMTVRLCVDTNSGTYVYRCPKCLKPVVNELHPRIRDLLLTAGVKIEPWFLPEEGFEAHDGPPISFDDVLDFHLELNR